MRIGICDRDSLFLQSMEKSLEFLMEEKGMTGRISCFVDTDGLVDYLQTDVLDLLFLEVKGEKTPIFDIAKRINQLQPACEIAYCSDSLEYAADAYETRHCYYLLKTDVEERLSKVIDKVENIRLADKMKVCIYSCGKNELVSAGEIMYAERSGKKSHLHMADGTILETPEKIDEIAEKLVWPQFVRCHNSFVISFDKMRTYTRLQIVMEDGREIPVSRPYLKKVRRSFNEWNKKNI